MFYVAQTATIQVVMRIADTRLGGGYVLFVIVRTEHTTLSSSKLSTSDPIVRLAYPILRFANRREETKTVLHSWDLFRSHIRPFRIANHNGETHKKTMHSLLVLF